MLEEGRQIFRNDTFGVEAFSLLVVQEGLEALGDRYTILGFSGDARHRLLLVLSDGKPNDVDEYEGRCGVEDAAMAVRESRQEGLATFCLTVDRECTAYLPSIFGSGGFALLPHATRLPRALAAILEHLIVHLTAALHADCCSVSHGAVRIGDQSPWRARRS